MQKLKSSLERQGKETVKETENSRNMLVQTKQMYLLQTQFLS